MGREGTFTGLAKKISLQKFGQEFDGEIVMSEKLLPLRRYGEYSIEKNVIYLSSHLTLDNVRLTFLTYVLKHELCHWYAYKNGFQYQDGLVGFEDLLRENGFITNGNYPHTEKRVAFLGEIQRAECSKCGLAQFDKLPLTRDLLPKSHCCNSNFEYLDTEIIEYEYYIYK